MLSKLALLMASFCQCMIKNLAAIMSNRLLWRNRSLKRRVPVGVNFRRLVLEGLEGRRLLAFCALDNLFSNCGFEEAGPPAQPPTAAEIFHVIPPGSTAIKDWQVASHPSDPGGNVDWVHRSGFPPSEGLLSVDLSGTPGRGEVSQDVPTVPGVRYELTFDLAGNPIGRFHPNGSDPLKKIQVLAAGQSKEFSYTVSPTSDANNLDWTTQHWSFIANSTMTTVTFRAIGPDPRVDNDPADNADFGAALDEAILRRALTGSIHGAAYDDLDGDGQRDAGEPGLDGKRIHLLNTSNNPVTLDGAVDTNPIFGGSGGYVFAELGPASYRVHELAWSGYVSTLPASQRAGVIGYHDIQLVQGQVVGGANFPNAAPGSIHGFKFEDLNANGIYEQNIDRPQPGVEFELTGVTGGGDPVSQSATTGADGQFEFLGLLPSVAGEGEGTGYTVTEVVPVGFANTTPNPFHTDLFSGEELVAFDGQADLPLSVTVSMSGDLRGDRGDAERRAGPFLTNIRAGDYKLTLVSSDNPPHGTQNQLNEQYFIRGWDAANNLVLDSPAIGDLPDALTELTQVVAERITLPSDVVRIEAFHISARTGVGGVNSIMPVRAVFESLDPRTERPEDLFFGNAPTSTIEGQKFRDQDADGVRDSGEPGLNGWTIQLVNPQTGLIVQEQTTRSRDGEPGRYTFSDVLPGEYEIREVEQVGWQQTFPEAGIHELTVGFNETYATLDFGNAKLGSIHGAKFEDVDGDGVRDENEPGLNGWPVQLVNAMGGVVQEQLTRSVDGKPGQYSFIDVLPGSYEVREENRDGWRQTSPATDSHSVTLELEQTLTDLDFGNTVLGSIHGFKFNDVQGDGIYDPQVDSPLAGIGFRLRGTSSLGEEIALAAETDERGEFWFTGLSPSVRGEGSGTGYGVVERVPEGSEPTTPPVFITDLSSRQELVAFQGQAMIPEDDPRIEVVLGTDLMFGNREITSEIHGFKFEDLDKDGVYDADEPGLGGVVIYIDLDGNGQRGFDEAFVETSFDDQGTPEDESGLFSFTGLPAGTYVVAEESPRGYEQSFPAEQQPYVVELAAGEIVSGLTFGNKESTNFGNVRLSEVHGQKIHDLNANGQLDPNEPGLAGVTIRLVSNDSDRVYETVSMEDDPITSADETGMFWFVDVIPGEYTLQEVLPEDWFNTFPGPEGQQVFVGSGTMVDGLLIGNAQFASIHGLKYNDQNGNGLRDADEPAVAGIVVFADLNGNGTLEAGEPATRTMVDDPATSEDETGRYWLADLLPGDYLIREVITQEDVVQTAPGGELQGYEVILTSGQILTGIDFGNTHLCSVHGWKWEDLNLNGRIDSDEPGVAGVTIYADLNRNGELDLDEPFTLSMEDDPTTPRDETGQFWLEGLLPGEYVIREIVPEGWVNVYPVGGQHLVVLEDCGEIGPSAIQISTLPTPAAGRPANASGTSTAGSVPSLVVSANVEDAMEAPLQSTSDEVVVMTSETRDLAPLAVSPQSNLDVSSDGVLSVDDVQLVIDNIRENGLRAVLRDADTQLSPERADVNQDGWISAMDVLLVINALLASSDELGESVPAFDAADVPIGLMPEGEGQASLPINPSESLSEDSGSGDVLGGSVHANLSGQTLISFRVTHSESSLRDVALDELLDSEFADGYLNDELVQELLH